MNTLSIRTKVVTAITGSLALMALLLIQQQRRAYRESIDLISHQSLTAAQSGFAELTRQEVDKMRAVFEAVVQNPKVLELYSHERRLELYEYTKPLFESLDRSYGITNFNYIDASENRILVMAAPKDPKLIHTKAVRFDVQRAAVTKDWASGLALGNQGFALRVAHPVWDSGHLSGGKLLGYLELGKEVGSFAQTLKVQSGNEIGFLLLKRRLTPEAWAASRTIHHLPNNWADRPDTVLGANTSRDESLFAYAGDITQLADHGVCLDVFNRGENSYARTAFPIKDGEGARAGAVFVLSDVTASTRQLERAMRNTLVITLSLIVALSIGLSLLLQRLVFQRLHGIVRVATRVVGGDYASPIAVRNRDEIGQFESLFEQFRQVFVNLLSEVERHGQLSGRSSLPIEASRGESQSE